MPRRARARTVEQIVFLRLRRPKMREVTKFKTAVVVLVAAAIAAPTASARPFERAYNYPMPPAAKVGDTPADDPGAKRAPQSAVPTTVEVVRPERTIIRHVDQALPIVLSSAALLLAATGCSVLVITGRRRRHLTGSH
jgi:hypothetical protein